ncbi:MAG: hypothetical protein H7248_03880 [Microbacteriaceae bacterium]|nr:hypothetical protein [Microbacteriaceae bacterium]
MGLSAVVAVGFVGVAVVSATPTPTTNAGAPPPSYEVPTGIAPNNEAPAETIGVPTRVLLALNESGAWRGSAGGCPAAPTALEFTIDGGATWTPSLAAPKLGVSSVLTMNRGAQGSTEVVGQPAAGCVPQLFSATARSDRWQLLGGAEKQWYVVPGGGNSINTPSGVRPTPCAVVVGVSARTDGSVGVLCSDQRLFRSRDSAASWDAGLFVPGARSIDQNATSYLVAVAGRSECAGVQIVVVYPQPAPRDRAVLACHKSAADTQQVVISNAGTALWLWAGDELVVTTDRGVTWR